ncbi:DUF4148 domain-containing protein [Paraburkholderia sp.]|uniref:DUF4148 domain-containing protein n=1 Tax=Paraburkholderia sp. TaxID=1926495 RepID=UPI0039E483A2
MNKDVAVGFALLLLLCSSPVFAQMPSSSEPVSSPVVRPGATSRAEVQAELLSAERAGVLPMNDQNYPSAQLAYARGEDLRALVAPQTLARQSK